MYPTHIFWTREIKDSPLLLQCVVNLYLSFIQLKESYGKIFLMTDIYGKYLMTKLNIPYNHIDTSLEFIANEDVAFTDVKVFGFKSLAEKGLDFIYFDFRLKTFKKVQNAPFIFLEKVDNEFSNSLFPGLPKEFEPHKNDLCFLNVFRCSDNNVLRGFYESYFSESYKIQYDFKKEKVNILKELFFMGCIHSILEKNNGNDLKIKYLSIPPNTSLNSLINNFKIKKQKNDLEIKYSNNDYLAKYPKEFSQLFSNFKHL